MTSMATPSTGTTPVQEPPQRPYAAIIGVLVVTAFVMILNETVLSVALPTLMHDLSITATTAQWLSTAFMLTMAVVIPTTGFLLNRLSTRQVFSTALILFTVGTATAALAPGFETLLIARIVQASGTAMLLPLLMTTTLTLVPVQKRGTIMGLSSVVISTAPALGPTLSGIILQNLTWHWLFIIMTPIAVVALILGLVLIKNVSDPRAMKLDLASVLLSALGFGGIVYGLASLSQIMAGTQVTVPVTLFILGALALGMFVVRQTRLERSGGATLLNLTVFSVSNFRTSVLIVVFAMLTMLGTVVVLPIYLTGSLHLEVLVVGLILLPGGLIQGVLSPFAGRIYDRRGARVLVVPGVTLMGLALWLQFFLLSEHTPVWLIVTLNVIFGIGMSLVMTPLMTLGLGSLPRRLYADGSAIMNTLQQLSGAAGTALFIALFTFGTETALASGSQLAIAQGAGVAWPFAAGGVLAIAALVMAFKLHKNQLQP